MVSCYESSEVLEYIGCLNLSKLKEMEKGSKFCQEEILKIGSG